MTLTAPEPASPPKPPDHNRTHINFRRPMPRPNVRGPVIDFHCHLLARRHGKVWFEAAAHYGIDCFVTMNQLEEALGLQRDFPGKLHFIAVAKWAEPDANWYDDFRRRIEAFYNLGSRIVKFHQAPSTIQKRGRLDDPRYQPILREIADRKMAIMTHVGDPDTWYCSKYSDCGVFGARDDHYAMWESVMQHISRSVGTTPRVIPIAPGLAAFASRIDMLRASIFGAKPLLTPDRMKELTQANWTCDDTRARLDIDYESSISLPEGLKSTAEWYRANKWL